MKIAYFTFSLMLIVIQNAFGQIGDLKGPYPFDADALQYLSYNLMQNDSIAPVYAGNGFQYIDTYSKMPAVRQKFEMAYPFAGNFGLVKVNGKYGIIDRKGMFVVPPDFPRFQLFHDINYGISFDQSHYFSFEKGKLLKEPELTCGEPATPYFCYYKRGAKFGLIYKADTVKKPVFDSVLTISDKVAIVQKRGKIGAVDKTGKVLLKFNYQAYAGPGGYFPGFIFALKKDGAWYYYVRQKKAFESKLQPAYTGGILLVKINDRYNYLNIAGKLMLSSNYKWIAQNGALAESEDNKIVFLLKAGKELVYY
jgi:hypothetical protein